MIVLISAKEVFVRLGLVEQQRLSQHRYRIGSTLGTSRRRGKILHFIRSTDFETEGPLKRAMLHWRFLCWRLISFPVGLAATVPVALLDDDDIAIGSPVVVVTAEVEVLVFWFCFVLPSSLLDAVAVALTWSKLREHTFRNQT